MHWAVQNPFLLRVCHIANYPLNRLIVTNLLLPSTAKPSQIKPFESKILGRLRDSTIERLTFINIAVEQFIF